MSCFKIEEDRGRIRVSLTGEVAIAEAAAFQKTLAARLKAESELFIDAQEAERIDAAMLQVLLAAAKSVLRPPRVIPGPAWAAAFQSYALPDPYLKTALNPELCIL